jgi:hypothetical protein
MTQNKNNAQLLAWAGNKIRKAQEDNAYCAVVVHMKAGQIFKIERTDSFVPPSAGALVKETGS